MLWGIEFLGSLLLGAGFGFLCWISWRSGTHLLLFLSLSSVAVSIGDFLAPRNPLACFLPSHTKGAAYSRANTGIVIIESNVDTKIV